MNKLLPLTLAIASIVAFPMVAQAQSLYQQHLQERDFQERTSPQDSNYVRLVSSGMQDRLPNSSYQNQHQQEYSQNYSREYTFTSSPSVTESGTRPTVVPSGGWARDMPLALAVRQVVPANFSLNENGVSLSSNVSWSGDLPWPLALQDISRQGHFVSHIDWDKKEVSLAPVMAKPLRHQSSLAVSSTSSHPRSSYATTAHDRYNHDHDSSESSKVTYIQPNTVKIVEQQQEQQQTPNTVAVKSVQQTTVQQTTVQQDVVQQDVIQQDVIQQDVVQQDVVQQDVTQHVVVEQAPQEKTFDIQAGPHSKDTASVASTRIVHVKNDEVIASKNVAIEHVSVATPSNVWMLDPELTLRENVEKWAKRVGWHVVWEGADYPIIAPASFSGEFASPTGPLARLISAYESSDQPLVANLTTMDKVVYVKNKYYENPEVEQTSAAEISSELYEDPKN